jgi:crossover junction endodeoxyribonuclease RuvC
MQKPLTIIGIDPGSRIAGFGVVSVEGTAIKYLGHGQIRLPAGEGFERRLCVLSTEIKKVISRFSPEIAVIERVFLGKNADSAFKLGHARGVCMLELASQGAQIAEYAAREIKKGVTGSGTASKEQVAMIIRALLKIKNLRDESFDSTDALAMAYFHAVNLQVEARFAKQKSRKAEVEL